MIVRKPVTDKLAYEVNWVVDHLRDQDREEVMPLRLSDDPRSISKEIMTCPYFSWVFHLTRIPVAVVGAFPGSDDVWEVFMLATHYFDKVAYPMTEFVKRDMIPLLAATGVRRAQCLSLATHEQAHRWLAFLGAVPEPTDVRGRNGENYLRFVWQGDHVLRRQQTT